MVTKTLKKTKLETSHVRSYMAETETVDVLHLDRVENPWARDIAETIEKLVAEMPSVAQLFVGNGYVAVNVTKNARVEVWRDGVAVIKVTDCVLIVDNKFLLMCADRDGLYAPVVKAETVTWDGTEEYFTPFDIFRIARDAVRRILERASWV
jgi:hypothetical protein